MNPHGHFIITAAGHELDLQQPKPAHLGIEAMAHSLAQINRFTGHAARPNSVAEHSLLVCEIAEREFGLDYSGQLAALLHDAHECVATDMHSPGKRLIGAAWHVWERRWMHNVRAAHRVLQSSLHFAREIKQADLMALATERRDLMPPTPTEWPVLAGIEPVGWVRLWSPERNEQPWSFWRDRFLDRYHELKHAISEGATAPAK